MKFQSQFQGSITQIARDVFKDHNIETPGDEGDTPEHRKFTFCLTTIEEFTTGTKKKNEKEVPPQIILGNKLKLKNDE